MRGFVWAVALLLAFGLACGDGGGSNGALLPRDGTVIRGDRRPLSDAASELASLDRTGSVADATVDAAQIPIDGAAPEADAESECRLNSDCPPTQYCGRSDGFCHATGGGVGVGGTQCVNQGECSAGFVCAGSFFPMCSAICDVNADCGNMITCTQSLTDANILFCSLLPF